MMDRNSMRRWIRAAAITIIAALSGACSTLGAGSHADESADFGAFGSFSWVDPDPLVAADPPGGVGPLAQSMIEAGLREQLELRGYAFTEDRDAADLVVAFTVGSRDDLRMDAYPVDYRGHWGWHKPHEHYFFRDTYANNYREGTLGVDIFDNDTGKPVWHGWAENTVTRSRRDDAQRAIAAGIRRMFASFPN